MVPHNHCTTRQDERGLTSSDLFSIQKVRSHVQKHYIKLARNAARNQYWASNEDLSSNHLPGVTTVNSCVGAGHPGHPAAYFQMGVESKGGHRKICQWAQNGLWLG